VRVALVDPLSYTPPYDHGLASALARRGHDVHLLTSRFLFGAVPRPDWYQREELFLPASSRLLRRHPRSRARFALKGAEYGPSALRLLRRLDSLAPEVVHVQWLPLPRLDRLWLRRAAVRRPTVFTAHDVLPRRTAEQTRLWLALFRTVSCVVVHSEYARGRLEELGVEPERLVVIPHPAFERHGEGEPEAPGGSTILFFGLIRPYKGLDTLITALGLLREQGVEARLVVAGDPLEPVDGYRELARHIGVEERIDWRLGFVARDAIAPLMAEAALVALPYREIDASGVLADAIGHGRPVVVSDLGALGETVRRFGAGETAEPGNPKALADALARLLAAPGELRRAYEGALAARAALTWDAAAEAHEQLYEELVSSAEGPA